MFEVVLDCLTRFAFRVFVKLYKESGFRNSDAEYSDRQFCTQLSNRVLNIGEGVVLSVPVYECTDECRLILQAEDERTCLKFCVVGCDEEHMMDVLVRDIGLEHYSTSLECMVCTATGYSVTLGLITIYSRVPIPVKPWLTVVGNSDDGHTCSICWDSFCVEKGCVSTPCGHLFHEKCLARWADLHKTCPYCRGTI